MKMKCHWMVPSVLVVVFYGFSAAADCGSAVIVSQTDADALSACPTITGDVIIATNAAGAIKLNGVQSIEGNLISKQCFPGESPIFDMIEYSPHDQVSNLVRSGCFGLLSLSSSTLVSVSQNITLQNLLNITTISLPALETIGTHFYLDGLPILTKLAIPKLSSVGGFHLAYAPALLSINLDGLTHLSSVYINSVGLLSMPAIDVKTKITSFVVGGVPNMPVISVWTPYIGLLQVNGNGFTTMATYNLVTKVDIKAIDTFSVSGCGVLSGVEGDVPITNENFIATGNSFQSLNLASWTTNGSTYIQGNPQLKSIEWNFNTHVMDTFVIRDNPLLNDFTSFEVQNVSSLVLVGSFDTEILFNFPNLENVFGQLRVESTNTSFNCSRLSYLRQQGYSGVGGYNCQGNTTVLSSSSASLKVSFLWLSSIVLLTVYYHGI